MSFQDASTSSPEGKGKIRCNRRSVMRAAAIGAAGVGLGVNAAGFTTREAAAQDSGCGDTPVTISYGIWDIAQKPGVDQQIEAFQKKFPNIKVTLEVVPWSDYWTKLQTGLGGGKTYDVFWSNTAHLPVFASQGSLSPLTDAISSGGIDPTPYPKSLLDAYTYDGVVYGIPRDFDTIALAYHKDLFDAAGVAYPDDTWTWDNVREAAEKLTVKDGDNISQWGYGSAPEAQQNFGNYIFQNEGDFLNKDHTKCTLDEPAACEALDFLTKIMADKLSPTPAEQQANTPYETLFPAGVIAMIPSGSWNMLTFHQANPNINVAPLPKGKQRGCVIHGLANLIWSGSPNQCAAMEFVKFLTTKEAEEILGNSGTVIPAMNGLQDAWAKSLEGMDLQVFLDAVEYSFPIPNTTTGDAWLSAAQDSIRDSWNDPSITGEQVCKAAADAANKDLA